MTGLPHIGLLLTSAIKSRLRQQYEDAQLAAQQPPGLNAPAMAIVAAASEASRYSTDPTVLVAERRILDAARRGELDNLPGAGLPRRADAHRDAAAHLGPGGQAAAAMAGVLAANQLKPLSVELRLKVDAQRSALVAAVAASTLRGPARRTCAALRAQAAALALLVRRQHGACVADSLAFGMGAGALQCAPFNFDAAVDAAEAAEATEAGSTEGH